MASLNDRLTPGVTYRWWITVDGPIGDGRNAQGRRTGTYRVPNGKAPTNGDVMERLRLKYARELGIPDHAAVVLDFRIAR
ncbi:hypothetical protein [Streptomyces sp. NPDC088812]|uniref:hypothetical protein n=1 Tax=Streptomyces sp. NPDC088812 TaxID=3365905 RepID=UPI0037FD9082